MVLLVSAEKAIVYSSRPAHTGSQSGHRDQRKWKPDIPLMEAHHFVTLPHVLVKTSGKASPDSRDGETDRLMGGDAKSHCKDVGYGTSEDYVQVFNPPQRLQNIFF